MSSIKLYSSKAKTKESFVPLDPLNVGMYVCGPTVYDRAHLGNARPVVIFDLLFRILRHQFGTGCVNYVRNFTDIDDKINMRAVETGRVISDITEETIQWFISDMDQLGALEPTSSPRATHYIPQMIKMIENLVGTGHAYERESHVLFRVRSFSEYGKLSGRLLDDMIAGSRVEVAPFKEDPLDFVLWKPSAALLPGWESRWGRGRPGWHIECSAMSKELLGESFDIHCGGNDLLFPHHENELAQSKCAHPQGSFASYWLHNEMLKVDGKKMSKSLKNFLTVNELLKEGVPGDSMRLVLMNTHYRKPMNWTSNKVVEATLTLRKWKKQTENIKSGSVSNSVIEALCDDINSPKAITELHGLSKKNDAASLLASAQFMGLFSEKSTPAHAYEGTREVDNEVLQLIKEKLIKIRSDALAVKDFRELDQFKNKILTAGVEVQMSKVSIELIPNESFDPLKLWSICDE
jgi:cysteinyl-tRNA synthetase